MPQAHTPMQWGSAPAPKFVRRLVNGRPVFVRVMEPRAQAAAPDVDSFPTLGAASAPKVSGAWASGVQPILDAKEAPDPAIAKRQREYAKSLWLKRQRAARATSGVIDYDDEAPIDDDLGLDDEVEFGVEFGVEPGVELEVEPDAVLEPGSIEFDELDQGPLANEPAYTYASVRDGEETDSLRRVVTIIDDDSDWW